MPPEPRKGTKPEPIGNFPTLFLFTTCTICALFLLWRRADTLRRVVAQTLHLKTWSQTEGNIRLSEDDGPSSTEFLDDGDDDEDAQVVVLPTVDPQRTPIGLPPSERPIRVLGATPQGQ
ncbi:hypothetical protein HGRIS_006876 [Hohenbuehelia grisea]|uniref:Uncharacterized protein n=1 Tax=Hohenbuehelia grisea TaxID=104357 RepID=A0ABR3JB17_9AGAR